MDRPLRFYVSARDGELIGIATGGDVVSRRKRGACCCDRTVLVFARAGRRDTFGRARRLQLGQTCSMVRPASNNRLAASWRRSWKCRSRICNFKHARVKEALTDRRYKESSAEPEDGAKSPLRGAPRRRSASSATRWWLPSSARGSLRLPGPCGSWHRARRFRSGRSRPRASPWRWRI